MRVYECPAGYTLSRDDVYPDQDRCIVCTNGFYSLTPATSNQTVCKPCPIGGDCPGGNIVNAKEGFWRRMMGHEYDSKNTPTNVASDVKNTSFDVAHVFRCPPGLNLIC